MNIKKLRPKHNKNLSQHFEKSKGLSISYPNEMNTEDKEVEEWLMKDEINEIENKRIKTKEATDLIEDLSFFCKKPKDCASREKYGNNCRCIRENFSSPDDFNNWTKTYSNLIEKELYEIIRRYKI